MEGILERANIPKEASIAFEGVRCKVYQWPQSMYDGTTATFERVVRIPAATVIAVVDGKILIQEQEQPHRAPFLCLAGGHADSWDETLDEVAKRELLEETGLVSDDWELLVDISHRDFSVFEHHLYLARNCKKVAEPHFDNGERIINNYVLPEEFKTVMEDPRWRHADVTAYFTKPGNFEKFLEAIK